MHIEAILIEDEDEFISMKAMTKEEVRMVVWDEYGAEAFSIVKEETCGTWRHGSEELVVIKRKKDDTYWKLTYRTSPDGEYNALREMECLDPYQVWPAEVVKTVYVSKKPE